MVSVLTPYIVESLCAAGRRRAPPDYLTAKVPASEYRVHQCLQVVACGMIAMQVHTAVLAQYAAHLQQTNSHPAEERGHVIAIDLLGARYDAPHFGIATLYLYQPLVMNVVSPRPSILKRRTGR